LRYELRSNLGILVDNRALHSAQPRVGVPSGNCGRDLGRLSGGCRCASSPPRRRRSKRPPSVPQAANALSERYQRRVV